MSTISLILALFVVGMILVALEVLVLPGLVTGLLGALIIAITSIWAWSDLGPAWGLTLIVAGLTLSLGLFILMPRTRMGRRLILTNRMGPGEAGYDEDARRAGVTVGQLGTTATPLRPSGFALFGESRVEVRTEGEWLDRDARIEVIRLKDGKVWVERVSDTSTAEAKESSAVRKE